MEVSKKSALYIYVYIYIYIYIKKTNPIWHTINLQERGKGREKNYVKLQSYISVEIMT